MGGSDSDMKVAPIHIQVVRRGGDGGLRLSICVLMFEKGEKHRLEIE